MKYGSPLRANYKDSTVQLYKSMVQHEGEFMSVHDIMATDLKNDAYTQELEQTQTKKKKLVLTKRKKFKY